jgi:hypothetical protein
MESHFYRFRSTAALLDGFQELEKQEIYFASREELNDPMDGFKDVVWRGDRILWTNLLNHYLLCLLRTVDAVTWIGKDKPLPKGLSFVHATDDFLKQPVATELYRRVRGFFFRHPDVSDLPDFLAQRTLPLRRNELTTCIRLLHFHALNSIFTSMREMGMGSAQAANDPFQAASASSIPVKTILHAFVNLSPTSTDPSIAERAGIASELVLMQHSLVLAYRGQSYASGPAWQSATLDFPRNHVIELERLLYSDWYTACFVADFRDAAMWGNYADRHKGVCLKFRAHSSQETRPTLKLTGMVGMSGRKGEPPAPIYGEEMHELCAVSYSSRFVEIDFFRSLGNLTRPMLNSWYLDSDGNASPSVGDIKHGSPIWRENYWRNFQTAITTKSKAWKHEREWRMTLNGLLLDLSAPPNRKLRYRFEDLHGIIFGVNTSTEDKLRIMRIVAEKCRKGNRTEFELHQTSYESCTGKIDALRLTQIQFP